MGCGSPFLCLPGGGTATQVGGFTPVGGLVQLSAPVLGSADRELPEWVRCGLARGVLGIHRGQLRGFGAEIFPRLMSWLPDGTKDAISAGTMTLTALQVSYTLLSQSAPSSQSWSSQFNGLHAVRAGDVSLWQHPAQLGKLGLLTGSPLPTQANSQGILCWDWGEVMLTQSGGGQTVLFFSPIRCWNFSGNLGLHKGSPVHT